MHVFNRDNNFVASIFLIVCLVVLVFLVENMIFFFNFKNIF